MTVFAAHGLSRLAVRRLCARSALATSLAVAGFAFGGPSSAAENSGFTPRRGEFCTNTAKAARISCQEDTQAEFWLAIGICQNIPGATPRRACTGVAQAELESAGEQCGTQFEARDDLCDALGEAAYAPPIDPANFVASIDNPFLPLVPGATRIYRSETDEGVERIVVTVTDQTEIILGVRCTVVRDTVTRDGVLIEDTIDWYAQDRQGNVWYFGEIAQNFKDGDLVNLDGSWRAGVEGAIPGIVMPARPRPGQVYRQEFALGEAEDFARIVSLSGRARTPAASCDSCLVTSDLSTLEPDLNERKFYARGIGFIFERDLDSGETLELIEIGRAGSVALR